MTVEEVKAHAQKFSQTYRKGIGPWKEMFEQMGQKTTLKKLLTKWAPKSIEMQQMAIFDQSVVKGDINDIEHAEAVYADSAKNETVSDTTDFQEAEVVEEPAHQPANEPKPEVKNEEEAEF